ncbi:hypothetical protein D3C77_147470 [compost metagenome]
MPATGVDPAVDLDGDHVGGPRKIEAPLAARVEHKLSGWFWEADKLGQHALIQGINLLCLLGFRHNLLDLGVFAEQAACFNGG